ncbi:hypothetical protein KY308_03990 [Candidatus Woesearchaeota archaeon]|nr:hypothetical protein [Candidatus Woesearchaeota archaeon]
MENFKYSIGIHSLMPTKDYTDEEKALGKKLVIISGTATLKEILFLLRAELKNADILIDKIMKPVNLLDKKNKKGQRLKDEDIELFKSAVAPSFEKLCRVLSNAASTLEKRRKEIYSP